MISKIKKHHIPDETVIGADKSKNVENVAGNVFTCERFSTRQAIEPIEYDNLDRKHGKYADITFDIIDKLNEMIEVVNKLKQQKI